MEQACSSAAFALPVWPAALQLTKVRTVRRGGPRVSHQGGPTSSAVLQNAKWMGRGRDSRGSARVGWNPKVVTAETLGQVDPGALPRTTYPVSSALRATQYTEAC